VTYVVVATYNVKEGEGEHVAAALRAMVEPTRAEPGCRFYEVHRSLEDPLVFFLYERYDDQAAFQAHAASEHFARHIRDDVWQRVEQRARLFGAPLDEDAGGA
jgi:quinol monooxygenase YgiN